MVTLLPLTTYSQGFKLTSYDTPKGKISELESTLVTEVESKTAEELYTQTINWIKTSYNSPEDVIKSQIENEYIRFEGISSNKMQLTALGLTKYYDIKYNIEVRFKDGKFKTDILKVQFYFPPNKYNSWTGGWTDKPLLFATHNKRGKMLKDGMANSGQLQLTFNGIVDGIKNYNDMSIASNEDW